MAHPINTMYANVERSDPQLQTMTEPTSAQYPPSGTPNGVNVPTTGIHYFMPPPPPRYIGTRYHTSQELGVYHHQPIHFFRLSSGQFTCRHGPCMTCYPDWYASGRCSRTRRESFPPGSQIQFVSQISGNSYTQSAAPQPPPQVGIQPAMQPTHSTNSTVHPQLGQMYPHARINAYDTLVNQETLMDGNNVTRNQEVPDVAPQPLVGIHTASFPVTTGRHRRVVNSEKVQRIHDWRAEVEPELTPTLNDEQLDADEDDRGDLRFGSDSTIGVKRRPDIEQSIESGSDLKRVRMETEDTSGLSITTKTESTLNKRENKAKACVACREAHKKCDGRFSACAYAQPEAVVKPGWRKVREIARLLACSFRE